MGVLGVDFDWVSAGMDKLNDSDNFELPGDVWGIGGFPVISTDGCSNFFIALATDDDEYLGMRFKLSVVSVGFLATFFV